MAGKPAGYSRALRSHVQFSAGVPRVRRILYVYMQTERYIAFIINGQIKAYINGIIGLFLVSQPSLSTTIGASDQDPLLSTGGGRIGKEIFSQDTRVRKINTDLYIIHNKK